jgi:hypothetical protein
VAVEVVVGVTVTVSVMVGDAVGVGVLIGDVNDVGVTVGVEGDGVGMAIVGNPVGVDRVGRAKVADGDRGRVGVPRCAVGDGEMTALVGGDVGLPGRLSVGEAAGGAPGLPSGSSCTSTSGVAR